MQHEIGTRRDELAGAAGLEELAAQGTAAQVVDLLDLCEHGIRVTLISPGNVDTPFFENQPPIHMTGDDVARAVMFAVSQPPGVGINEIRMRHPRQTI